MLSHYTVTTLPSRVSNVRKDRPMLVLNKLDLEEITGALADQTDYKHR